MAAIREVCRRSKSVNVTKLADEILAATGLRLRPTSPTDTVHGYITAVGGTVWVFLYAQDEEPNTDRTSTARDPRANDVTTKAINTLVDAHIP